MKVECRYKGIPSLEHLCREEGSYIDFDAEIVEEYE